MYIYIYIYIIYIYVYIYIYTFYVYMKTMCPPGHHHGFLATHALGIWDIYIYNRKLGREEYVFIFLYIWTAEDLSKTGIWR